VLHKRILPSEEAETAKDKFLATARWVGAAECPVLGSRKREGTWEKSKENPRKNETNESNFIGLIIIGFLGIIPLSIYYEQHVAEKRPN